MNPLTVIFGGLSALGVFGGAATLVYANATRRKITAEAKRLEIEPSALMTQQAMEMYDRLRAELKETRADLRTEEAKSARLEEHVRALEDVLRDHKINPPPWPPLRVVSDGT